MPWRVVDGECDPRELELVPVTDLDELLGLGELHALDELSQPRTDAGERVGEHHAVVGVDVDGNPVLVGERLRGPGVIQMPMGEQHRLRGEVALGEDLLDARDRLLAGVDDDGRAALVGRHDIAVRGEHARGKTGDQHPTSLGGGSCPISQVWLAHSLATQILQRKP
ncbi:Uncharacterised protein [Mycobacteroides abscessus subsp. massiliense]|nr:Uncharacterised protein [Mycobacteroides abscessus subsp. massiliense]